MPMWRTGESTSVMPWSERLAAELLGLLAAAVDLVGRAVLAPDAVDVADELGQALACRRTGPASRRPPGVSVSLPSLKAPAPPQPQVMSQGSQPAQTPVLRAGQPRAADVGAALDEQHRGAVAAHELERGEDAGGAGADDDQRRSGCVQQSMAVQGGGRQTEGGSLYGMIAAPRTHDKRGASRRRAAARGGWRASGRRPARVAARSRVGGAGTGRQEPPATLPAHVGTRREVSMDDPVLQPAQHPQVHRPSRSTTSTVERLLRAAMAAPSAGNQQPWQFVVIRDRATLDAPSPSSTRTRKMLLEAPPSPILVCGDPGRGQNGRRTGSRTAPPPPRTS